MTTQEDTDNRRSGDVLSVHSAEKQFDGLRALDCVSVTVKRGEILGVIGPNGSGKTTLLNVVTGVVKSDGGEIRCGGQTWSWLPPHRVLRNGVARTFQNIRLFEEMTVAEHVRVALSNSGISSQTDLAWTEEILETLDLTQYADSVAETLAYGLQRRVELARALASKPAFLLLDEPAAGLNPAETEQLHRSLFLIREALGCGIVLIDHDVRLIMRTCERVVVLNEGKVISEGSPDDVRRDPAVVEAYLG